MKHLIVSLALAILAGPVLAADTVLRLGDIVAPGSVQAEATERFAGIVNEADVGLEVQTFHGGALGTGPVQVQNVSLGVQEMFIGGLALIATYVDDLKIAETPFTFDSREHFEAWVQSPGFDRIMEELVAGGNQRIINREELWRRGPFRVMLATKPVLTLEDLATTKLRLWESEVANRFWGEQGLGAIPVNLPFGDVYVGLRQGVVEAVTTPFDLVVSMKFHEVAPHLMYIDSFWQMLPMTINEDVWQSLNDTQRQTLIDAANEAGRHFNQRVAESVEGWKQELTDAGVTFHEVDRGPWVERIQQRNREWAEAGYWRAGLIEEIEAAKP